jgi:hypoxanthine-guanine phosphoribosyltransferase
MVPLLLRNSWTGYGALHGTDDALAVEDLTDSGIAMEAILEIIWTESCA